MRTLLLLLISVAVVLPATESNPRVTRLMETFTASATAAEEAYQQAIQQAEAARAAALTTARDRTITGLKRLVNNRSGVAEQAEVYTQVLRLNREDTDAVRFFTAIGTLEQVLAGLEPAVETDLLGNIVGGPGMVVPRLPDPVLYFSFDGPLTPFAAGRTRVMPQVEGPYNLGEGVRGKSYSSDRGSRIILPFETGLPVGNEARTTNVWIRTSLEADGWRNIIRWGGSSPRAGGRWGILLDSSSRAHFIYQGSHIDGDVALNNGEWRMLTLAYADDTVVAYVDGQQIGSVNVRLSTSTPTVLIGANSLARDHFMGDIDEIMIWDQALTAEQINALYQSIKP